MLIIADLQNLESPVICTIEFGDFFRRERKHDNGNKTDPSVSPWYFSHSWTLCGGSSIPEGMAFRHPSTRTSLPGIEVMKDK